MKKGNLFTIISLSLFLIMSFGVVEGASVRDLVENCEFSVTYSDNNAINTNPTVPKQTVGFDGEIIHIPFVGDVGDNDDMILSVDCGGFITLENLCRLQVSYSDTNDIGTGNADMPTQIKHFNGDEQVINFVGDVGSDDAIDIEMTCGGYVTGEGRCYLEGTYSDINEIDSSPDMPWTKAYFGSPLRIQFVGDVGSNDDLKLRVKCDFCEDLDVGVDDLYTASTCTDAEGTVGDYCLGDVLWEQECSSLSSCGRNARDCPSGYSCSESNNLGACEPVCGDNTRVEGEDCDGGTGCNAQCECEEGYLPSIDLSATGCAIVTTCGNGQIDANEQCDDKNTNNGDGCSDTCQTETGVTVETINPPENACSGQASGLKCEEDAAVNYCVNVLEYDGAVINDWVCDNGNHADGNWADHAVSPAYGGCDNLGNVEWFDTIKCYSATPLGTCTDTEIVGVPSIYNPGTTTVDGVENADTCNGDVLTEYSCNGNVLFTQTTTCDLSCTAGACETPSGGLFCDEGANGLPKAPATEVSLDDGGDKYYCDLNDLTWVPTQANGASCFSDYQCDSGSCADGTCFSVREELASQRNILIRIWCVVTNLGEYVSNLDDIKAAATDNELVALYAPNYASCLETAFQGVQPNVAPIISNPQSPTVNVLVGASYTHDYAHTDSNGDDVVWSITGDGSILTIDSDTGVLTYVEPAAGEYPFTVTADDQNGGTTTDTFNLVVAAAIILSITPSTSLTATVGIEYTHAYTYTQVVGTTLTWSDNTDLFDIVSDTGVITFTPVTADIGTPSITITVTDAIDSVTDTFTLTIGAVPNNAPVITNDPLLSVGGDTATVDTAYTYTYTATDADSDTLTWSDDTDLFDIVSDTGVITFTPVTADRGDHTIDITVTDAIDSVTDTFTLTIGDIAPD